MGSVSVDIRSLDTSERRGLLGRSSPTPGPSSEDPESDDACAAGKLEGRLRGAMRQATSEGYPANGGRFPQEDYGEDAQRLKFNFSNDKRNGKKSTGRKRKIPTCRLHTTASTRRFWSFFEFAPKEEVVTRESRKYVPRDIVSPTPNSPCELEDVSRSSNMSSMPVMASTLNINPKVHGYQLDMKAPMNCVRIPRSLKEDNLVSILDGNPVPKTLKWKLKGYKTLRNEQAGDFAFVPGGMSHDFDILYREGYEEAVNLPKIVSTETGNGPKGIESGENIENNNTLTLTTRSIENKSYAGTTMTSGTLPANAAKSTAENAKPTGNEHLSSRKESKSVETAAYTQKLTTSSILSSTQIPKKEIKYLPISKSDLSANQLKHQSQQSAPYSSRPPKRLSKPMPPVFHQNVEGKTDAKKLESAGEFSQEPKLPPAMASKKQRNTLASAPEGRTKEYSVMEQKYRTKQLTNAAKYSLEAENEEVQEEFYPKANLESHQRSSRDQRKYQDDPSSNQVPSESRNPKSKDEPAKHFAPQAWSNPEAGHSANHYVKSTAETLHETYESIGVSFKPTNLKFSNDLNKQMKSSPCAATHARLQKNGTQNGNVHQGQGAGSYGYDGSSNSGGGGSRKPPPTPPFIRKASTDSSSPMKKSQNREVGYLKKVNSKGSRLNISTSSARRNPRKCDDDEKMIEGKTICTKPRQSCKRRSCDRQERKCQQERPKCKQERPKCKQERPKCQQERPKCKREPKVSKKCKRYCCPSLQEPTDCDFDKPPTPQCKNDCGWSSTSEKKLDPSCLPAEDDCGKGREICTAASKRRERRSCERQERSCKRERSCQRDRGCQRERSCNQDRGCQRERQSCQRREPSCKRQEQQGCSRDQGREICTKPRKRDSCSRRRCDDRDCGKQSAKCTGRRHFTHSAYIKRNIPNRNLKRFTSVPFVGFTLFSMNPTEPELKENLFVAPPEIKYYGNRTVTSIYKSNESISQTSDYSCKSTTNTSCYSTKSSCKSTKKSKCKKPAKCLDGPSKGCKKSESKSCGKPKDSCKSNTEDSCSKKRKEQLCAARQATCDTESEKDRRDRELKEMKECKSPKKDKKEKKSGASGLERVVSSCKKQKGDSDGCSTKRSSCTCVPLKYWLNPDPHVFMTECGGKPLELMDRSYTTISSPSGELNMKESRSNQWRNFWNFTGDDVSGLEGEIPLPIVVENSGGADDTSYGDNWFLPWFNANNP